MTTTMTTANETSPAAAKINAGDNLVYLRRILAAIDDEKDRAVFAMKHLPTMVDSGNIEGIKLLFTNGAFGSKFGSKLLELAILRRRAAHDNAGSELVVVNNYRETIEILIDHGAKLDNSNGCTYDCIYNYLLDRLSRLTWLAPETFETVCDVIQTAMIAKVEMEVIDDLKLLTRLADTDTGTSITGTMFSTLSKVLQDEKIVYQLFDFVYQAESKYKLQNHLLTFLLDQGLNPNFRSTNTNEWIVLAHSDLLFGCLLHSAHNAAGLLLEYGYDEREEMQISICVGQMHTPTHIFDNLRAYLDDSEFAEGKSELLRGLTNKIKRRRQVYPAHLKLALDKVCSPFDISPLTFVISDYVL